MSETDRIGEGWAVTRGTEELEAERQTERAARLAIEHGLAKCPVCRGAARIVEFGLFGTGVWIGCDRTEECSRYIELHTEGWSIEECAAEWNKCNSGVCLVIRRVKKWFRERFGAEKRAEKRKIREEIVKNRAESERRREIFGVEKPKKRGFWSRMLARRQKVSGGTTVEKEKDRR